MDTVIKTARLLFENTIHDYDQFVMTSEMTDDTHLKLYITLSSRDCYDLKKKHGRILRAITALIQNCATHAHLRATVVVSE
ncbi:MAG: hypothetical protein ACRCV7_01200 [Culicoidibacterales bacterium]